MLRVNALNLNLAFVYGYFMCITLYAITGNNLFLILEVIALLSFLVGFSKKVYVDSLFICAILGVLIAVLNVWRYDDYTQPVFPVLFFANLLIAQQLFRGFSLPALKQLAFAICTTFIIMTLIYIFFISSQKIWLNPFLLSHFVDGSRNEVGGILILTQSFYALLHYRVYKKLPVYSIIITLLLCFLAYGRSSLGLAFVLFLLAVLLLYKRQTFRVKVILAVVVIVGLGVGMPVFFSYILDAISHSNFHEGLQTPRYHIWSGYFDMSQWHISDFIFGHPYTALINSFHHNPHNSFIRGFHYMGLPFILLCLLLFIRVSSRLKLVELILFLIVMARLAFDTLSFPGFYDFMIFSFYYITFIQSKGVDETLDKRYSHQIRCV